MSLSNNITAPLLLIFALLIVILFQTVFFTSPDVLYAESGEPESGGDYIVFNNVKYNADRFFMFAIVSNLCAFLLPAVFYVKLKGIGAAALKLDRPRPKYLFLSVYAFLVLISGSVLINSLIFYIGGTDAGHESVLPLIISAGGNPVYDVGIIISFIALPALCEEFFFRSVLSAEYEKYGATVAVFMTGTAFAASHFSIRFFPAYFFAAVILYILIKITNSVLYAVAAHAGYNFFNIYLWGRLAGVLNFEQNRFIFTFINAIVFIVFLLLLLNSVEIIYYDKGYRNEPSPPYADLPEGQNRPMLITRFFKSFFSPTFIIAAAIFFVYVNI